MPTTKKTKKSEAQKTSTKKDQGAAKKTRSKKPIQREAAKKQLKPAVSLSPKTTKPKKQIQKTTTELEKRPPRYYESVGRRKRAVARTRLFTRGEKEFLVNGREYRQYFTTEELRAIADGALRKMKVVDKFRVSVKVRGGGINGQAEAVRHGIARALVKFNLDFRKRLKRAGYLRRDPRETERKKFGLKKARRAPQWQKR